MPDYPVSLSDRDGIRRMAHDKIRPLLLFGGIVEPTPYIWVEEFECKFPNIPHNIWASYDDSSGIVSVYRDAGFGLYSLLDEFKLEEVS
jgi:hypothetical protein